ncbi:uncharacterized protein LOC129587042 [Paramacrobiotus metropolitanus]|uniref:uncharacterized protein LOC129587042 n=1 Tax=Paramacrobiotus metropolitanus TaxID=2943436 RepID=UPI002445BB47|nr:uncharacterized protein LOC129587042 [Paramacrobiotus metropolitanus]
MIMLILVILRNETLRHGSGLLIAHLLFVNVIICGCTHPIYILDLFAKVSNLNFPMKISCTPFMYIHLSFFRTECFASLVVVANRFIAVVYPHNYHWLTTKPALISAVIFSWACGFAVYIPALFGFGQLFGKFPPFYNCGGQSNGDGWSPILGVVGTYIPLGLQGALYLIIALKVLCSRETAQTQRMQKRIAIAKMLCGSFLFYACCFIPMTVVTLFFPYVMLRQPAVIVWLTTLQILGYSGHPVRAFK